MKDEYTIGQVGSEEITMSYAEIRKIQEQIPALTEENLRAQNSLEDVATIIYQIG